jgi:hypothetical protein
VTILAGSGIAGELGGLRARRHRPVAWWVERRRQRRRVCVTWFPSRASSGWRGRWCLRRLLTR